MSTFTTDPATVKATWTAEQAARYQSGYRAGASHAAALRAGLFDDDPTDYSEPFRPSPEDERWNAETSPLNAPGPDDHEPPYEPDDQDWAEFYAGLDDGTDGLGAWMGHPAFPLD